MSPQETIEAEMEKLKAQTEAEVVPLVRKSLELVVATVDSLARMTGKPVYTVLRDKIAAILSAD